MAYSYIEYVGDGSTKTFNIPFTYLKQADVKVYVGGVDTAFTFTSASVVSLATAPASGVVVRLARTTDASARAVDFQDGSVLSEEDLDKSADQVFKIAQEAIDRANESVVKDPDGLFSANNLRIKNLANPVNAQDAVTKSWAESGMSSQLVQAAAYAAQAADNATQAASSKTLAASSATSASASETNANSSKINAANSATTAATKATEASNSASAAASSATSAASSATNANTSANNAASYLSSVQTNANNAISSAAAAASSATSASTSATNAAAAASNATASATQAANSATQAANSASSMSASVASAAASATSASTDSATASTKASEASASASSAASSAATATAQATTATTKANNASASASAASSSQTSAAASATAALQAMVATELARDQTLATTDIYPDIATALAAVVNGGYFGIPGTGNVYMSLYRNESASAVLVNTLYASKKLDEMEDTQVTTTIVQAAAIGQLQAAWAPSAVFPD